MLIGVILGVVVALLVVVIAIAAIAIGHQRKLNRAARRATEAASEHARAHPEHPVDGVRKVDESPPARRRPALQSLPARPSSPEEEAAYRKLRNARKRARREVSP